MTTVEFIHKKNALVKRVTGVILVPEDQIVETPRVHLPINKDTGFGGLGAAECPYCQIYREIPNDIFCTKCPIELAGNRCVSIEESSYHIADRLWIEKSTKADHKELRALCEEYNKEN